MTHTRDKYGKNGGERGDAIARVSRQLSHRGRVCLRVQGSSMLPWVRPGDIAILRKGSPEEIRSGDIVMFRRYDRFFVHRIVERRTRDGRNIFVTKGDSNPHFDGEISQSEILGRVERIYRGGRRIEFHSHERRTLNVLIARVSRKTSIWAALVLAHRIAIRPARRLLLTLRSSLATPR